MRASIDTSVLPKEFRDHPVVKPQDGFQTFALANPTFEMLVGGQAGPGKTWFLVIDALGLQFQQTKLGKRAIDVPEYRGILFRRKKTELAKLVDETKRYYSHPDFDGQFVYTRPGDPGPSWNFPSGARIFLCHMQHEKNKDDHATAEYQYIGFDQVEQFTVTQYLYMFSRARSTIPYLFPRLRASANPVGIGLIWLRSRFVKNLKPFEINYFIADREPERNPQGIKVEKSHPDALPRLFVPGTLAENKILMRIDPAYASRIKQLGARMERALLGGDWWAFAGEFFPFDPGNMIIAPFHIPKQWPLYGSLDPGWTSPCSFSLRTKDFEGNVYRLGTYYEWNRGAEQHAKGIVDFIRSFKWTDGRMPTMIVAGEDAFARKDRFAVISHEATFADVFRAHDLVLQPASTSRKIGWGVMQDLMWRNKWFVFDHLNEPFIDEITAVQSDQRDPQDIQGRGNDPDVSDHALDDERYGDMAIYTPGKKEEAGGWMKAFEKAAKSAKPWKPGRG